MNAPATAVEKPSKGWITLLAAIVAIAPMSIDMYLPGLPELQRHFGTDAASTQLTLSAYFIGLATSQLAYGPIADRFGRRPPLLFGLGLYVLVSLGCVFAPTIEALIGLRFLQALGGAAGGVMVRAMVRDRYPPQEMARISSMLLLVMGVAPILAPSAGGMVLDWFGWQAIFAVLVFYGAACFVGVWFGLPETIKQRQGALSFGGIAQAYARMLKHRRFMGYALSGGIAQAGMFAYIAGSSFVFIEIYGLSPKHYGWLFGANAFGLIMAAQVNARLLGRVRAERILMGALTANATFSLLLLLVVWSGVGGLPLALLCLFCAITSLGFSFPNSTAAAMAPFGDRAGMASALLGTLQFTLAGCSSALLGHLHNGTAVPMAAVMTGCGVIALGILYSTTGRHSTVDGGGF